MSTSCIVGETSAAEAVRLWWLRCHCWSHSGATGRRGVEVVVMSPPALGGQLLRMPLAKGTDWFGLAKCSTQPNLNKVLSTLCGVSLG